MERERLYQLVCVLIIPMIIGFLLLATPGTNAFGYIWGFIFIFGSIAGIILLFRYDQRQREVMQTRLTNEQVEKLQRLLKVSTRVRIPQVQEILNLRGEEFWDRLLKWAERFGFQIEEDVLVVNPNTAEDFVRELEREFQNWGTDHKI